MTDPTNPSSERFRISPSEESVEGCLGASSAGQGALIPPPTPTPLDLAALRSTVARMDSAGILSFPTKITGHQLAALIALAEAAEAKIAEVEAAIEKYEYDIPGHGDLIETRLVRAALTGHWKALGGTPTGDLADVCACGKSYWPCDSLDGTA